MNDLNNSLAVFCEATKQGASQTTRYSLLIVFSDVAVLNLDQKIAEVCHQAGYLFLYTDHALDVEQYIAQELPYSNKLPELCQQLSDTDKVALTVFALKESSAELADMDYLNLQRLELKPLVVEPYTPLENVPWLDSQLKPELFGQKNSKKLNTYLIIDAARYRQCGLMKPLDLIDEMPVECLYTGEAATTYRDNAPYLIDMTLSEQAYNDTSRVPQFHRKIIDECWPQSVGIFIRTSASMEQVHKHFRKLLKIQDQANDKLLNFHFYDPQVLSFLLPFISNKPSYISHWFDIEGGTDQDCRFICRSDENEALVVHKNEALKNVKSIVRKAFSLDNCYQQMAEAMVRQKVFKKVQQAVLFDFPEVANLSDKQQAKYLEDSFNYAVGLGFKSELALGQYVASCCLLAKIVEREEMIESYHFTDSTQHENEITRQILSAVITAQQSNIA